MTTSQQAKTAGLCQDGDQLLAAGCVMKAVACYINAFKTHASSTVSHMRNLEDSDLAQVISALEDLLDGEDVQESTESLNKGIAAVFLSTICPNNLSASLFKMECILHRADHGSEEIFARCSAFLSGKSLPTPTGSKRLILELTQALASFLSEPEGQKALSLYLTAFQRQKSECVRLIRARQAQHLPKICKAFTDQIQNNFALKCTTESKPFDIVGPVSPMQESAILDFLVNVCPDDPDIRELQGEVFFSQGNFDESSETFSLALQLLDLSKEAKAKEMSDQTLFKPNENKTRILIKRAAANFSVGGRASDVCSDLSEAFAIHPATARLNFQQQFSDCSMATAAQLQLRQQAERGLSGYRETVLTRPDLRSTQGVEALDPVIAHLRTLCHLEQDGGGRELRVRLADCLLLRGEFREALSISSQLAGVAPAQQSYQNTVQVLHGYARLLSGDHQGALEDFQAVIEHRAPHPSSCVRALCGRGLLRMIGDSFYLTALDYMTACGLQAQETAFTVRCLVPWNYRGLLCTVLQEQGRAMLENASNKKSVDSSKHGEDTLPAERKGSPTPCKDGSPAGVHVLAQLLMDLQPGSHEAQILTADALYRLGRVEEAYRLLLSIEHATSRSPILARLALLQLHRGFLYDANQLLKKLIQCGDTSCLCPLLVVASPKDRALLQLHCFSASKRTLNGHCEEGTIREAVAYLSIAIIASGGEATEALLERAKCYALLGQRKTAIFDFNAILRGHPNHVPALCGRAFTYLTLNQQKECTKDVLAALWLDPKTVTQDIVSMKEKGRKVLCDWLHECCQMSLSEYCQAAAVAQEGPPTSTYHLQEACLVATALLNVDSRNPKWHLLYIDTLLSKGELQVAVAQLRQVFGQEPREPGAQARWGVVEARQQNFRAAAQRLARVAEREPPTLRFLLQLVGYSRRKRLAQAAMQEAGRGCEEMRREHSLPLLTVAVQAAAAAEQPPLQTHCLRQRATCLTQLGLYERAAADLDKVIQGHGSGSDKDASAGPVAERAERAEDLCARGRSLLLSSRERLALEDFLRALKLHRGWALQCIEAGVGKAVLAGHFLQAASQCYAQQQLREAWELVEGGLKVEAGHPELRRLRARIKQEVSPSCIVH